METTDLCGSYKPYSPNNFQCIGNVIRIEISNSENTTYMIKFVTENKEIKSKVTLVTEENYKIADKYQILAVFKKEYAYYGDFDEEHKIPNPYPVRMYRLGKDRILMSVLTSNGRSYNDLCYIKM